MGEFDWDTAKPVRTTIVPYKIRDAAVLGFARAGRTVTVAQMEWRRAEGVYCAHLDGLFYAEKERN